MDGELFPRQANYANADFPVPWPHQETAHQALRDGFRNKHRRQLLVAPTGSGKTVMGLRVIHEALIRGRRATFVCDRTALIDQTSRRADDYGLRDHAIVQANHPRRDNSLPFQIASIQTIDRRGYWPASDVIIIDEAHTLYGATRELLAQTEATVIGLTATPCTKGLGLLYTNVVNAATMHELTESGVLVPMRILTCITPDMTGAATAGGEWTNKAASERELQIIGDVVTEWLKHAENRKTIAFGPDIAYCTHLVQRFNEAGVCAETFTNETSAREREELLREFTKTDSRIRILVSVEALAKGFDVQDIGCVIDARPLRKSLSTAIQMWGRGLRASTKTGKQDCLLLDHSGNIRRFYDDFADVFFNGFRSLDMAQKLDAMVRKDDEDFVSAGCPNCKRKPFRRRCLACGYEKVSEALASSAPGEMVEVRIGKKVIASDKRNLYDQLCSYARQYVNSEKRAGWVWYKFQEIVGEKPPRSWSFDEAPDVPISSGTLGKLKSLRIAFAKGRAGREARP